VAEAATQGLGSALARWPSAAGSRSQASRASAIGTAASHAWLRENRWQENLPIPVSLPVGMALVLALSMTWVSIGVASHSGQPGCWSAARRP
jgi:hypothetical protein